MEIMNNKPRLEWVDTAKGICILLVIIFHTTGYIMSDYPQINCMLRAIRMPLYFTIAGLFVSVKSDVLFIEKKVNRLIIPYCFFLLIGNITDYIYHLFFGEDFKYFSPLYFAYTEDPDWEFLNFPVWFLVSLFDVYIIFIIINKIANYFPKYSTIWKVSLGIIAGICGFACNRKCIDLPLLIDSSLSATPFLIFGHIAMSKTTLFKREYKTYTIFLFTILLFTLSFLIAKGDIDYFRNNPKTSLFHAYIPGVFGVTAFLLLSKAINKIPLITHIGRYSIVYLGTHALFPEHIRQFILTNNYFSNQITIDLIVFFSTILLCSLFCWILLKTVPYLIAQKELIYFRNLHEN